MKRAAMEGLRACNDRAANKELELNKMCTTNLDAARIDYAKSDRFMEVIATLALPSRQPAEPEEEVASKRPLMGS